MRENRGPSLARKARNNKDRYTVGFVLAAVLFCVFRIYQPALNGPFVFDDGPNLVENHALHLSSPTLKNIKFALESVQAGPFGRPVAYLSFALNYYFFGPEAYSFKLVNLIIHLLNGVCVFLLTKLLLRAYRLANRVHFDKQRIQWLALATASLWLLHPLALTSVLYIVQRMNSLATLLCFLTFLCYFSGRLKQFTGRSGIPQFIAAFGIFAPLAVFSKENSILIPYFLLISDWILLRFKTRSKSGRWIVRGLLLSAVLPLIVGLSIWDDFPGSLLAGYKLKPFTLSEHVLTESRVLWYYLKLIFIPDPADFGLYHDDITVSKGLFQPLTTVLSVAGLLLLVTGALLFWKKAPVLSFAILFFLIGHSLESSIFSLEIAHEHRNYLPMFAMVFLFAYYGLHPRILKHSARWVIAGFVLLLGLIAVITMNRASDWKDIGSLSIAQAQHHPHSARSNYEAGRVLSVMIEDDPQAPETKRYYKLARRYFTRSYQSDKFNPAGLFGILYLDSLLGQATDVDTVARLIRRLSEYPLLPATSNSFSTLQKCHEKKICHIDSDLLIGLYESALTNKRAENQTRASLFNELAILKLEHGDTHSAIGLFKQSIELNPAQPQLRFNLAHVLITTGRLEEAQEELRLIRERFPHIREEHKLTDLEKMFAKASGIADYR